MDATTVQVIEIRPQEGRQAEFLASPADIVIYGGSAGGGKTYGLLMEPLRHIDNPNFGAVIFRRSTPEITKEGGMWDESKKIYIPIGARSNENEHQYTFRTGARVTFAHLQYESTLEDWRGAQIPLIEFDQLETFTEKQFFYMLSRNRSTCGVRPYIRATANPEPGWLADLLSWWIDDDGYANLERAGQVRWFVRSNEVIVWANTPDELQDNYPNLPPKSLTFIPATIFDNKILIQKDPGYLANLKVLALVDRERLLGDPRRGGNWKIKPEAGKIFNRSWFEIVYAVPAGGIDCRFWDFAATEKEIGKDDPDFTSGVKIRKVSGMFFVLDCVDEQISPSKTNDMVKNLAIQDQELAREQGASYKVRWEMEGGASGKRDSANLIELLVGYDAKGVPPQGDKIVRAKPLAAQAEAGNVKLLKGQWNERWLVQMHGQPDLPHDDIMDGSSGAFNELNDPSGVFFR